jgi:putative transposase
VVTFAEMAARKTILATGETYHVLNRSIQGIPIFKGERECKIFLEAMEFYLQPNPLIKFSLYRTSRDRVSVDLRQKLVTIINYCIMPNHFHFTLRQEDENGIKKFIQRLSNSFAHYFNIKYKNRGSLFEGKFKAIWIENEEQLVHLSRYIHLNPVSSYLVEKPQDYLFSSYEAYLANKNSGVIDPTPVLKCFSSAKKYREFIQDQKDYQRRLEKIKHLALEQVALPGS